MSEDFSTWQSVRSTPSGFRATFPNQPEGTTDTTADHGEEIITTLWTAETTDFACTAGIVEFSTVDPNTDPNLVLDGALNGILNELKGELMDRENLMHSERPALDAVIKFEDGWAAIRMLSAGRKLFYAQVLAEEPKPDIFEFFADSFELLPPV